MNNIIQAFAMAKKYDAIIFDWDGTLVDAELAVSAIDARVLLACLNLQFAAQEIAAHCRGKGTIDKIKWATQFSQVAQPPERQLKEMHRVRTELMKDLYNRDDITVFEGAHDVMRLLGDLNFKTAIASNNQPARLAQAITKFEFISLIDTFAAADGVNVPKKPEPDLFLNTASALGFSADRCLVIEDSIAGVQAGVAAGMPVLGFCPPGGEEPLNLLDAGALTTIDHYSPQSITPLLY